MPCRRASSRPTATLALDWLVTAKSPTSNVGTTWGTNGVIAWFDANNDVGDNNPLAPDPPQGGNGYETPVSDQGGGSCPGCAYARIDPADPTIVEIAIKRSMLGTERPGWRAWAEKGLQDNQNWYHHDKYTSSEAGSPYINHPHFPIQNIYEDDNTVFCA